MEYLVIEVSQMQFDHQAQIKPFIIKKFRRLLFPVIPNKVSYSCSNLSLSRCDKKLLHETGIFSFQIIKILDKNDVSQHYAITR